MHQTKKGHPVGCPFFVSMEFERLGLHGAADAGPGCPGGERRQWRMQRTGAGWAAAQSDASACYARSQRDTPQPDESLEVHHKKAGRLSCLFVALPPTGAASPFALLALRFSIPIRIRNKKAPQWVPFCLLERVSVYICGKSV